MDIKKCADKSIEQDTVVVDVNGVHTKDARGNGYYHGRIQTRTRMTSYYFDKARQFWASQTINGQPMELLEVMAMAAANATVPYNSELQRRDLPRVSLRDASNHVGWYNIRFANGETGWLCDHVYRNATDAAQKVAVETVLKLYTNEKTIQCVRALIEKQNQK